MVVGEAVRTGGLRGAGAGDEDGHRRVERGRRRELRHRHAPQVSARHAPPVSACLVTTGLGADSTAGAALSTGFWGQD